MFRKNVLPLNNIVSSPNLNTPSVPMIDDIVLGKQNISVKQTLILHMKRISSITNNISNLLLPTLNKQEHVIKHIEEFLKTLDLSELQLNINMIKNTLSESETYIETLDRHVNTVKQNLEQFELTNFSNRINSVEQHINNVLENMVSINKQLNDNNELIVHTDEYTSVLASQIEELQLLVNDLTNKVNNMHTMLDTNISEKISQTDKQIYEFGLTIANYDNKFNMLREDLETVKKHNISYSDVIDKIKNACSQLVFIINGNSYVGSCFFWYDNDYDLSKGYCITAAHCVMSVENNKYYKANEVLLQNPINNKWIKIDTSNIFVDGIGDIALIQTNIDLSQHPQYCLQLSNNVSKQGDACFIVGNPLSIDDDSTAIGYIRDPHYCEPSGYQMTDTLFVSSPGLGGCSGGPIINELGELIGIYTFGLNEHECFGGGSNKDTLKNSLTVLKQRKNHTDKLFLGIRWAVPSPFELFKYYSNDEFDTHGVLIQKVNQLSPFYTVLSRGDILLSCVVDNKLIKFGNKDNQRTPGVLLYYPKNTKIGINYIKLNTTSVVTSYIVLSRTYSDVPQIFDEPLGNNSFISNKKIPLISFQDLEIYNNIEDVID